MHKNKILPWWYQLSFIHFENNYNSGKDLDYDPELDTYGYTDESYSESDSD